MEKRSQDLMCEINSMFKFTQLTHTSKGDSVKPGPWTVDWTMDWTVDWTMD